MNCGNQVAKNGRKKKRIVATKLSKMKEKKKMLCPQHFYNKLQVVGCYWFSKCSQ